MIADLVESLREQRVVAVVRRMSASVFPAVLDALIDGGIRTIEVTMDGETAAEQITSAKRRHGDRVAIGAGTVLTIDQLHQAHAAGAEFFVCPHLDIRLMEASERLNAKLIPGVFTPTEIAQALRAGADMVKLFPAGTLGPAYIRNILGPFHGLKIMATGGVSEKNMAEFFDAGVTAVGLGSNLFPQEDVDTNNWEAIRQRAKNICALAQTSESGG
jgi:2-dehydro-3-deoxyphosphogluconate aldolase / (4S)-4-hydroxy-2-oxoglutarate aldolase